jgi:hypothetical protein
MGNHLSSVLSAAIFAKEQSNALRQSILKILRMIEKDLSNLEGGE